MMKRQAVAVANIYVPVKRRAELKPTVVDELAASIMQLGQQTPILVRRDKERFVLVEGLQRLEACKKLGEANIFCYLVDARKH
jgi:sulfiredoxin